jgi:hypothetical protein
MTKTLTTLKDILTPLCKPRRLVWANEGWEHVFTQWRPIAREELEELFTPPRTVSGPVEVDFSKSERGQVLYLPPLEKNPRCVPILSLYCKLNNQQSIVKFRVMLVCLDNEGKPYGIGFRMETPESMNQNVNTPTNEGIHDFHHAQLIRKFGQRELDCKLKIECPSWLPESQPSFPLPAECPVMLLLCLILTLYGKRYYKQFFDENDIFDIELYKKKLDPWIN